MSKRRENSDWRVPFNELHAQVSVDVKEKAELMQSLAEKVAADRMLMESLPKLSELRTTEQQEHITDPPFVSRAAIFVLLAERLSKNLLGSIGRWGNNPTKQALVACEAQQRFEYLLRHVFNRASDSHSSRIKSGAQVVLSQLYEDLSLATGTELTLLRLERTADFNVLSLLATQLQAHQTQCEAATDAVVSALSALQVACEKTRADDRRQAPSATTVAVAERGTPAPAGDGDLTPRRMYRDNLFDETEALARELSALHACLAKLDGTVATMRWAMETFVLAVRRGVPVCWGCVETDDHSAAMAAVTPSCVDEDLRFWLQRSGFLARYGKAFAEGGLSWSQLKSVTAASLKEMGASSSDAKRILQLVRKEDPSRWDNVLFSGWLKKRGNINKGWKRRFFVLVTSGDLWYFKTDVADKPQDSIALRKVDRVSCTPDNVLQLHTPTRTYELMALTTVQRVAWMRLICVMLR